MAVPAETPPTNPVRILTSATARLLLVQNPPPLPVKTADPPTQKTALPEIITGDGFTVTAVVE